MRILEVESPHFVEYKNRYDFLKFASVDVVRARCPSRTRLEPVLVQSFPRTKASLVLMVCEIGAPKEQGSVHLARTTPSPDVPCCAQMSRPASAHAWGCCSKVAYFVVS